MQRSGSRYAQRSCDLDPNYNYEWRHQVEALLGGRFVLDGSVNDIRQQFHGLWQNLASKLPPPSDVVATRKCPNKDLALSVIAVVVVL
jgi:hypothetical protein